jgi:hypothetical protein
MFLIYFVLFITADKYCPLLVSENGLNLLSLLKSALGGVGTYATMAIENVEQEVARTNTRPGDLPMLTD